MRFMIAACTLGALTSATLIGQLIAATPATPAAGKPGMQENKSAKKAAGHVVAMPAVAGGVGPDVIVGELHQTKNWGSNGVTSAYSVGTTSCNVGDVELKWIQATPEHPVIAQNLYRLNNGRFEQLGQSWLKHGFCALQQSACDTCIPAGFGCPDMLGVGCSDPYSASLNGSLSRLGPRSEVNPFTGAYPMPFTSPTDPSSLLNGRIQVPNADVDPAQNNGARYFIEGHYIASDDAMAGNGNNNASYREVSISAGTFNMLFVGSTQRTKPAIQAWQDVDPTVQIATIDIPGDGRLYLGCNATDNGDGTWDYEYAIQNLNSDRCVGTFSVQIPAGVTVTNIDFHGVDHHSGEPLSNTPWTITQIGGTLRWSTESFTVNPNANAIRWGTLYNARFTADSPPANENLAIGLFRPGVPASMVLVGKAPSPIVIPCPADCDGIGDGVVNVTDLLAALAAWGQASACDTDQSGSVDVADLLAILGAWGGCP